MDPVEHERARRGLLYGAAAYGLWGLIPLYFKRISHVSPPGVLAHRIVWSCALVLCIITALRRWPDFKRALCSRATMVILTASTTLIAINWLTYIHAVATEQVLQSSLGYFVTPLMNVALGVMFLRERLSRGQTLAIVLALVGVVNLTFAAGTFPWIALVLSISFALYGLLRKTVPVDGLMGLTVETTLLFPIAAGYLLVTHGSDTGLFSEIDRPTSWLLLLSGIITTVPLLLFAAAARRLTLATLGILQYLAPTLQFLLAVLLFDEPFSQAQFVSFVCIWGAVAIYSIDSWLGYQKRRTAALAQVERAAVMAEV